ncbi:MAG: type ISP restriction/modification enzyme [Paracoccaceae bacterium]
MTTAHGLRVPLTADPRLFAEAAALGREVVWLHTYGERFADPAAGRRHGPPRLPPGKGPTIPREGAIPDTPEAMPDGDLRHDAATSRLFVGSGPRVGFVANVPKAVFDYEVSGKNVLRQWFSYRRKDRSRPVIGDKRPPSPLDKVQPDHWLPEYTEDLLNLLHVLGRLVRLEPAQNDLLGRVLAGPLISETALKEAGALPGALSSTKPMSAPRT